jgi:hypothetical protein
MSGRLRIRAARLIRQLDAGVGYRQQIEQELEKRLAGGNARLKPSRYEEGADADDRRAKASAERACASCDTLNDTDARFCKGCGAKL